MTNIDNDKNNLNLGMYYTHPYKLESEVLLAV